MSQQLQARRDFAASITETFVGVTQLHLFSSRTAALALTEVAHANGDRKYAYPNSTLASAHTHTRRITARSRCQTPQWERQN